MLAAHGFCPESQGARASSARGAAVSVPAIAGSVMHVRRCEIATDHSAASCSGMQLMSLDVDYALQSACRLGRIIAAVGPAGCPRSRCIACQGEGDRRRAPAYSRRPAARRPAAHCRYDVITPRPHRSRLAAIAPPEPAACKNVTAPRPRAAAATQGPVTCQRPAADGPRAAATARKEGCPTANSQGSDSRTPQCKTSPAVEGIVPAAAGCDQAAAAGS